MNVSGFGASRMLANLVFVFLVFESFLPKDLIILSCSVCLQLSLFSPCGKSLHNLSRIISSDFFPTNVATLHPSDDLILNLANFFDQIGINNFNIHLILTLYLSLHAYSVSSLNSSSCFRLYNRLLNDSCKTSLTIILILNILF
jgi:hypothetical protein